MTPRRADAPAPAHEVRIVDGRFSHAECTCGWRTAGRRDRRILRTEARDHALLYAGAAVVITETASTSTAAADTIRLDGDRTSATTA